jgi:hypothetical protein
MLFDSELANEVLKCFWKGSVKKEFSLIKDEMLIWMFA